MAPRSHRWTGLDTPVGFERCVRATLRELYGYLALLVGRDRAEAERLVADVYRSLFRAARTGRIESVSLGAVRAAGRRLWIDRHRGELASIDSVRTDPASTIDELSALERAVVVLLHVNGMSPGQVASELGRPEREVTAIGRHAVKRLRGTADTSGSWLRAYFGPTVTASPGLVDRVVRDLGERTGLRPEADAPSDGERAADRDPVSDELDTTAPLPVVDIPTPADPLPPIVEATPADVLATDEHAAVVVDRATEPTDDAGDAGDAGATDEPPDRDPAGADPVDGQPDDGQPDEATAVDADIDAQPDDGRADDGRADDEQPGDEQPAERTDDQVPESATDELGVAASEVDDRPVIRIGDGAAPTVAPAEAVATAADAPTDEMPTVSIRDTRRIDVDDLGRDPAAASGTRSDPDPPHRTSWVVPAVVVLLLAAAAGGWWFWQQRTDDGASPDAVTAATEPPTDGTVEIGQLPATTSTVAAEPTTTLPAPPTTAPATVVAEQTSSRFDPSCTSWVAGSAGRVVDLPATFGPLGDEPSIVLSIPQALDDGGEPSPGAVDVDPLGDGWLVRLGAGQASPGTLVTYLGPDGTVRWVRCFDAAVETLIEPNDDVTLAFGITPPSAPDDAVETGRTWYRVSLADGSTDQPADAVTSFGLDLLAGRDGAAVGPGAVLWDDGGVFGLGEDGDIVWTDEDVTRPPSASGVVPQSDGIAVTAVCPGGDCEAVEVRGYDAASGVVVWTAAGHDAVAAAGDGVALIGHPTDGWQLVELAFGDPVDGQAWVDPATFGPVRAPDDGDPGPRWSRRIGAAVFAIDQSDAADPHIDVWLPPSAGVSGVEVDLAPPS